MAKSRTLDAIGSAPADDSGEIPEWAKPGDQEGSVLTGEVTDDKPASKTPALDSLVQWMFGKIAANGDDDMTGLEAIVRQTLQAADPAEVLRKTMPVSGQDFVGVTMLLQGFTLRESDIEDPKAPPAYASLDVLVGEPPEPRVINVGSWKILAQLAALEVHGEWPKVVQIVEARDAKKGQNAPLMLLEVTPE